MGGEVTPDVSNWEARGMKHKVEKKGGEGLMNTPDVPKWKARGGMN